MDICLTHRFQIWNFLVKLARLGRYPHAEGIYKLLILGVLEFGDKILEYGISKTCNCEDMEIVQYSVDSGPDRGLVQQNG